MAGISHERDEGTFFPLRKKAKLHEPESNYVQSIYEECFKGEKMSELDIENTRWYNGIEVKGTVLL